MSLAWLQVLPSKLPSQRWKRTNCARNHSTTETTNWQQRNSKVNIWSPCPAKQHPRLWKWRLPNFIKSAVLRRRFWKISIEVVIKPNRRTRAPVTQSLASKRTGMIKKWKVQCYGLRKSTITWLSIATMIWQREWHVPRVDRLKASLSCVNRWISSLVVLKLKTTRTSAWRTWMSVSLAKPTWHTNSTLLALDTKTQSSRSHSRLAQPIL